ncbi:hypothetical protein SeMB42_g04993 [Synchytrium endobioticum]|uniref:DNA-directed RNA polymerase III subunit RPC5 n=1 Tax=Synchytrium endobioticum TaxID=286115 RepID=A0A507CUJ8_9FUNG|nr:hypothetical protein SeMB42_g04993 [Synchytrium endobioticum]TPX47738.1 hypothetical protein SeLEV6574_g02479 [Synchytrium endobioticum]
MPRRVDEDEEDAHQADGDIEMENAAGAAELIHGDDYSVENVGNGDINNHQRADDGEAEGGDGDDVSSDSSLSSTDSDGEEPEDDDPIEAEYPVIVTDEPFQRLVLLQFPTRHKDFILPPQKGMIRPKADMISLEVPIETGSMHYDDDLAHKLGEGYRKDVQQTAKKKVKRLQFMDTDEHETRKFLEYQKLESVTVPTKQNNYMVSMTYNGRIYLTTLDSILHMRHNLKYVEYAQDKDLSKAADKSGKDGDGGGGADAPGGKSIIQTAGRSEDKDMMKRLAQLKLLQEDDDEAWMDCTMNNRDDPRVRARLAEFIKQDFEQCSITMAMDPYLKSLHGNIQPSSMVFNVDDANDVKLTAGLSRLEMGQLTSEARLKAFMINAQIAPYKVIKTFMELIGLSEKQILELCQRVAVLVNGVWVVRSELVYKGRLRDARCYLLAMFTRDEYIRRKEFTDIARLPVTQALNILTELSLFVPGRGWRLRENDLIFEYQHPAFAIEQRNIVQNEAQLAEGRLRIEIRKNITRKK